MQIVWNSYYKYIQGFKGHEPNEKNMENIRLLMKKKKKSGGGRGRGMEKRKEKRENPNATSGLENHSIWNKNVTRLTNSRLRDGGRKENTVNLKILTGISQI